VFACSRCHGLVELSERPGRGESAVCPHCGGPVGDAGPARRGHVACNACGRDNAYPAACASPPEHTMWAIEYHCAHCKPSHKGRFFKSPDAADLQLVESARDALRAAADLPIPDQTIPAGDETTRLLRWGYRRYRDMFNDRQLLGLGTLLRRILAVGDQTGREALLTVFSDSLRYQNMLCRYDTYALKCQDVFAVHGFPVGLVQCENNLLGIPGVGSGGSAHFVEKYRRAKAYCRQPFESHGAGTRRRRVPILGEQIAARMVNRYPERAEREAWLSAVSATDVEIPPGSLDGVFTDPPYFANVQYAELMDFCYVWLRQGLKGDVREFAAQSTRSAAELTGNVTAGRDLAHFADGLSRTYQHYAAGLKEGAPFVFTYHHNELGAYAPLVVAVLDAGMLCTAVLPAPAEMGASLHINGTGSSIIDSVFVCRHPAGEPVVLPARASLQGMLVADCRQMSAGGVRVSAGDIRCLANGRLTWLAINDLGSQWVPDATIDLRLDRARAALLALSEELSEACSPEAILATLREETANEPLALF
jgi:hypothetical protein